MYWWVNLAWFNLGMLKLNRCQTCSRPLAYQRRWCAYDIAQKDHGATETGRRLAKAEGVHMVCKPSVDNLKMKQLRVSGVSIANAAHELGGSTITVKRMPWK